MIIIFIISFVCLLLVFFNYFQKQDRFLIFIYDYVIRQFAYWSIGDDVTLILYGLVQNRCLEMNN